MQLTVWGRGGYPYFAMYHYYITVLLYNILLYILLFKIATFFPTFIDIVPSYSSSFLKSGLAYFGLKPKLDAQNWISTSILVCIIL